MALLVHIPRGLEAVGDWAEPEGTLRYGYGLWIAAAIAIASLGFITAHHNSTACLCSAGLVEVLSPELSVRQFL
jgi:hypothetical protein